MLSLIFDNWKFRRLFVSRAVSLAGDWLTFFTLLSLIRPYSDNYPQLLTAVFLAKSVPYLLWSPVVRAVLERFPARRVLIISHGVAFATTFLYFLITSFPEHKILILIGVCFLQKSISAFFEPARSVLIKQIVSGSHLLNANVLNSGTWSFIHAAGMAAGGLLVTTLGWQVAIVVDAATFAISAFLLWRISDTAGTVSQAQAPSENFVQPIAGVHLFKAFWSVVAGVQLLLPLIAEGFLKTYPILAVSSLFVLRGIAGFLGPLVGRHIVNGRDQLNWQLPMYLFFVFILLLVLSFVSTLSLTVLLLFLLFFCGGCVWSFSTYLIQQSVPSEQLPRYFAHEQLWATFAGILSTLVTGIILSSGYPVADVFQMLGVTGAVVTAISVGLYFRNRAPSDTCHSLIKGEQKI